ncbi:MAG: mannonate dehydratase [Rikenellaceae bacterium]|nr:mannonate dehydratase [Rikenellaceae bacterium]
MKKTWRWFGKNDKITLEMLRQIGIQGIVTALHEIPNGEIWEYENILNLKNYIESFDLEWSVVESLPVSEKIKYAAEDRDEVIENYIVSLQNLGKAGVNTVCYNFMPVIDWVRTDLSHRMADGTSVLYFDKVRFAYFDIYIIGRNGAENDYSPEELNKVRELHGVITEEEKNALIETIIVKTQGFINGNFEEGESNPVEIFKKLLNNYKNIDKIELRKNLKYFLEKIMPVCNEYGIKMCIHPDDPPFQMLGLPRIITNEEDISWILEAVDDFHNGLTFCAGSLSAGIHNNIPDLAREFYNRTHFLHLRSTEVLPNGDFLEADHMKGRANIIELVRIFEQNKNKIPMRVDHGKLMLSDDDKNYNPGYSFHGRMYALAQIDGVLATIKYLNSEK